MNKHDLNKYDSSETQMSKIVYGASKMNTYNATGLSYSAHSSKGNFPIPKDSELERKLKQEESRKLQEREDTRRRRQSEDAANTAMMIAITAAACI